MARKVAIIIGAGPAGLTAAYELLDKTDIKPIIYEFTGDIGGIAKTVDYKGNKIDIGGHRFFSKSERIMEWWQNIIPTQGAPAVDDILLNRDPSVHKETTHRKIRSTKREKILTPDPEKHSNVMLIRNRFSRIFFLRKFFNYPLSLSLDTLSKLGLLRSIKLIISYLKARTFPITDVKSLEDFFINRFGRELYSTFFKDYTEKVWGIHCSHIKPEWGYQRIKGLSITKVVLHAVKGMFSKDESISQSGVENSLVEKFMYPKFGPGQMWEKVADIVTNSGGELFLHSRVVSVKYEKDNITEVTVRDEKTGKLSKVKGDYIFSTMPVKELIQNMEGMVPKAVSEVAEGLVYRDFITVSLLLKKLKIKNDTKIKTINEIIPDNWIYIQERNVSVGRIQLFNNWSPYMVKDKGKLLIGVEYFCSEGDKIWNKTDLDLTEFAKDEISSIGIIDREDVIDSTVIRMPKAYPAYFGSYEDFGVIKDFTNSIENLFMVGRNGMHRYNNTDHSMLTAIVAVENIINGVTQKDNIWSVNP